jgi:GTPase SAR1 family protein
MDKKISPKKNKEKMKAPLFKLVLVGDSGVGKTSLINSILV